MLSNATILRVGSELEYGVEMRTPGYGPKSRCNDQTRSKSDVKRRSFSRSSRRLLRHRSGRLSKTTYVD